MVLRLCVGRPLRLRNCKEVLTVIIATIMFVLGSDFAASFGTLLLTAEVSFVPGPIIVVHAAVVASPTSLSGGSLG